MTSQFSELSRRQRRQVAIHSAVRVIVSTVAMFVAYAVVPIHSLSDAQTYLHVMAVLVVMAIVIAWQVRAITRARFPQVRAVEGVLLAIPVLLILFAVLYEGMAETSSSNFNAPLDRVGAIYFTVTVLATVGFGDIVPRSDFARIVVTVQMLFDLTLVAVVARLFFSIAQTHAARRRVDADGP